MWDWLKTLSSGEATFVGSLTGSAVGLIALIIGALFNAQLNRWRDDRLRKEDAKSVAAALYAELGGILRTLDDNSAKLRTGTADFVVPDLAHSVRVFPQLVPKLGLLGVEAIGHVIDVHVVIDQYCEALTMSGGTLSSPTFTPNRRIIGMPGNRANRVAEINDAVVVQIKTAMTSLTPYIN